MVLFVAGAVSLAIGATAGPAVARSCPAAARPFLLAAAVVAPSALLTCLIARLRKIEPHAFDWRPFAAGWISASIIVGSASLLIHWSRDRRHREAFTPATWAAGAPSRVFLADDLVARGLLEGLDADGVEKLLGLPDDERNAEETRKLRSIVGRRDTRDADAVTDRTTVSRVWRLGGERQFMAEEELVVEFDDAGLVVAIRIAVRPF